MAHYAWSASIQVSSELLPSWTSLITNSWQTSRSQLRISINSYVSPKYFARIRFRDLTFDGFIYAGLEGSFEGENKKCLPRFSDLKAPCTTVTTYLRYDRVKCHVVGVFRCCIAIFLKPITSAESQSSKISWYSPGTITIVHRLTIFWHIRAPDLMVKNGQQSRKPAAPSVPVQAHNFLTKMRP